MAESDPETPPLAPTAADYARQGGGHLQGWVERDP
jgi:hypothetical protein